MSNRLGTNRNTWTGVTVIGLTTAELKNISPIQNQGISFLFQQSITAGLVHHKPDDPIAFVKKCLAFVSDNPDVKVRSLLTLISCNNIAYFSVRTDTNERAIKQARTK